MTISDDYDVKIKVGARGIKTRTKPVYVKQKRFQFRKTKSKDECTFLESQLTYFSAYSKRLGS